MTPDQLNLLHGYLNGTTSECDLLALETLLQQNADARRTFRTLATIETKWTELASVQTAPMQWMPQSGEPVRPSVASKFHHLWHQTRGWVAAAAVVLSACLVWLFLRPQVDLQRSIGAEYVAAPLKGELIGQSAQLKAGLVELHFRKSDALVVIEAPAKFRIIDAKTLRVESGRLSAHVKDGRQGLRILTPETEVLDLGTRFAVDVSEGKRSEVHVFDGKVAVGDERKELVTANQARSLSGTPEGRARDGLELRRAAFVQPEEIKPMASALASGRVEQWRLARAVAEKDPTLLAWRDFAMPSSQPLTPEGISVISGARSVQGRFSGQGALEFVEPGDLAKLKLSGRTRQLTLMSWVRLDKTSRGNSHLLKSVSSSGEGAINWSVKDGKLGFSLEGLPPAESPNEKQWPKSAVFAFGDLGIWRHLAVTYDADTRKVRFYIDGKCDSEVTATAGPDAVFASPYIGNYKNPDPAKSTYLGARMDELVIFKRILTPAEIEGHFSSGNPYQ